MDIDVNDIHYPKAVSILPNGARLVSYELSKEFRRYFKNAYHDLIVVYEYQGKTFRAMVSSHPDGQERRKKWLLNQQKTS